MKTATALIALVTIIATPALVSGWRTDAEFAVAVAVAVAEREPEPGH